jgi:hypothetical protein
MDIILALFLGCLSVLYQSCFKALLLSISERHVSCIFYRSPSIEASGKHFETFGWLRITWVNGYDLTMCKLTRLCIAGIPSSIG